MSEGRRILWRATSSRSDWRGGGPLRRVTDAAARLGLIERTGVEPGAEVAVSGKDPAPWEIYANVYPFDQESGWVDGMNNLFLTFDRSRVTDSKALAEAFFETSAPGDVEYAMIHPWDHWSELSDRQYEVPVTVNIQFRGVSWATFLGPGHLDEFDRKKLQDLEAHEVRWVDDKGLFVLAVPDLAEADSPETEPVLERLTGRFRAALRPDSRWR
jgi:hypothetical protein